MAGAGRAVTALCCSHPGPSTVKYVIVCCDDELWDVTLSFSELISQIIATLSDHHYHLWPVKAKPIDLVDSISICLLFEIISVFTNLGTCFHQGG